MGTDPVSLIFTSLACPTLVWLAQPNLHLHDVEAGEDAEHLQLLVGEAGGEVEVFMA